MHDQLVPWKFVIMAAILYGDELGRKHEALFMDLIDTISITGRAPWSGWESFLHSDWCANANWLCMGIA